MKWNFKFHFLRMLSSWLPNTCRKTTGLAQCSCPHCATAQDGTQTVTVPEVSHSTRGQGMGNTAVAPTHQGKYCWWNEKGMLGTILYHSSGMALSQVGENALPPASTSVLT